MSHSSVVVVRVLASFRQAHNTAAPREHMCDASQAAVVACEAPAIGLQPPSVGSLLTQANVFLFYSQLTFGDASVSGTGAHRAARRRGSERSAL